MSEIVIREAKEDDLPAVLRLYSVANIGDDAQFSLEEARKQFALFRSYPFFHIYIAEVEGTVVGTYELLIMDNMAKRGKKSGIVEDVAVDPEYQGKSIGRAMMEYARKLCREAGCYKLTLSSNLKRESAHRFYDALGFERHGYSFRVEL